MGNEGINALARTLQTRMIEAGEQPKALDFGSIQGDMSLLCNSFPKPIPQSDYVICRSVCYDPSKPLTDDVELPEKMYRIQPGDRVLVAWVGDDAVVIDLIMPAEEML